MSASAEPALRRAPIPLREPRAASTVTPAGPGRLSATQGTLALAITWDDVAAPDAPQPPLPLVPGPAGTQGMDRRRAGDRTVDTSRLVDARPPVHDRPAGERRAEGPTGLTPEPREWAAGFAQAVMEVATGMRPAAQLVRWTTPDIQVSLARRGALSARALRRTDTQAAKPRLRALVVGTPAARVCEVAAVMAGAEKVRALAFRMESFHGRWRVTELEIG